MEYYEVDRKSVAKNIQKLIVLACPNYLAKGYLKSFNNWQNYFNKLLDCSKHHIDPVSFNDVFLDLKNLFYEAYIDLKEKSVDVIFMHMLEEQIKSLEKCELEAIGACSHDFIYPVVCLGATSKLAEYVASVCLWHLEGKMYSEEEIMYLSYLDKRKLSKWGQKISLYNFFEGYENVVVIDNGEDFKILSINEDGVIEFDDEKTVIEGYSVWEASSFPIKEFLDLQREFLNHFEINYEEMLAMINETDEEYEKIYRKSV